MPIAEPSAPTSATIGRGIGDHAAPVQGCSGKPDAGLNWGKVQRALLETIVTVSTLRHLQSANSRSMARLPLSPITIAAKAKPSDRSLAGGHLVF